MLRRDSSFTGLPLRLGCQRNIPRHAVVGVYRPNDVTLGDRSPIRDGWRRPVTSRFCGLIPINPRV